MAAYELEAGSGRGYIATGKNFNASTIARNISKIVFSYKGWSDDELMGGDMVIFCDEVNGVQLYWNVALSDDVKYSAPVGVSRHLIHGMLKTGI